MQISENAVAFHDGDAATLTCACASLAELVDVAVALHLDHVQGQHQPCLRMVRMVHRHRHLRLVFFHVWM